MWQLIKERNYQPVEFSNVLYRPISVDLRLDARHGGESLPTPLFHCDSDRFAATDAQRRDAALQVTPV